MINIRQSQTNTVSISSLESLVTIPNPFFIFKWVDSYNYTFIKSFLDQSAYPERYSEFIVTDGSDLTFKASGHCYIYESPVDASAIDPSTMNLLTSEQYTFIPIAIADYVYEPSLYTYNAVDTVFDPQFNTNTPSPTYILHDDLSGRTNPDNHPQYIKEASLGTGLVWNGGQLDVSVEGGSSTQDTSIVDLYNYVEDLSTLVHDETQDPSIVDLYETAIFGTASSGTGEILLNVTQLPGELAAIKCSTLKAGTGVTFDISYGGVFGTDVDNITINASVGAVKDPSIDELYLIKEDKIPDGTFLLESSLGLDFAWNGGLLDVSIVSVDASIAEIYGDLSNRVPWFFDGMRYETSINYDAYDNNFWKIFCNKQGNSWISLGNYPGLSETPLFYLSGVRPIIKLLINGIEGRRIGLNEDTYVDASFALKTYVDTSLGTKVNQTLFDTSIASLTGWNLSQDASLILKANKSDVDSSFGNYYNKTQIDASLGVIYTKTQVDSSFGLITNLAKSPFQTLTLANAADSSIAWSIRNGWNAKYTLTKDVSLMIPDVSHGDSGTLLLIEDASGTWKMNLPANSFILSDASTITKTAGAKNFLTFVYDISTFYWNLGKNYIAKTQV